MKKKNLNNTAQRIGKILKEELQKTDIIRILLKLESRTLNNWYSKRQKNLCSSCRNNLIFKKSFYRQPEFLKELSNNLANQIREINRIVC